MAAIQAAAMAPWMARNHAISGSSNFASMKGAHLISFYAPLYLAKRDGIEPLEAKQKIWDQIHADPTYQALDAGGKERYLDSLGVRLIFENLPYALAVIVDNLPQLFLSYPSEVAAVLLEPPAFEAWRSFDADRHAVSFNQDSWALGPRLEMIRYYWERGLVGVLGYGFLVKALNGLVVVFAALGLVVVWRDPSVERRRPALFLFLFLAILTLVSALATQGRFRLPIMPVAAVVAVYGARFLWLRAKGDPQAVPPIGRQSASERRA